MNQQATSISGSISSIWDDSKRYIKERIELEVLKGADRVSAFCSMLITLLLAGALAAVVLFFILLGLAALINVWLQSAFWGYFIVAMLLLISIVLLFTFGKRRIRLLILDYIIGNMEGNE